MSHKQPTRPASTFAVDAGLDELATGCFRKKKLRALQRFRGPVRIADEDDAIARFPERAYKRTVSDADAAINKLRG